MHTDRLCMYLDSLYTYTHALSSANPLAFMTACVHIYMRACTNTYIASINIQTTHVHMYS